MQQDYTKIDEEHLKYLLDQAFGVIQGSFENLSQAELKALELIVHNTKFFQRVLGPQINLYDFLERIKHRLGHKMYPNGTIITPEGGSVPKLSIIIKGKARRFRPRGQTELENEVMENYLGPDPMEDEESKEDMTKLKQFLQKAKVFTEIPGIMKRFERCTQHISNLLPAPEFDRGERMLKRNQTTLMNVDSSDKQQNSPLSSEQQAQPEGKPVFRKQRSTKSLTMMQLASVKVVESPFKRSEEIKIQKEQQDKKNKEIALEAFILELDREDENKSDSDEDSPKRQQMKRLQRNGNLEKDLALITQILRKNPKQEPMFYIGGGQVIRNERVKEYVPGNYFGEHFLKSNKPKESLLIASEDLYVLTIDKEDVSELVTQLFDEAAEKANFFLNLFPAGANEEDVKSLSYHFREEIFQKDEKLFVEGENTKGIYILKSGNVGLVKKVENPIKEKQLSSDTLLLNANRTQKIEIPLAEIIEGHFFGDEILLDERKRKTTAICKALVNKVFYLEIDAFHLIKEEFTKLFKLLRTHAKERSGWRQERLENMVERALNNMNMKQQMNFSENTPKASGSEGKSFSRVKIAPIVTKGLHSAEEKEIGGGDYEKEGKTPGSSRKKTEITSSRKKSPPNSKNMDIYKEKFSRRAPGAGVSQTESPRKSILILKSKGKTVIEIEKEVIIPVNQKSKKQLSVIVASSLPKIEARYNSHQENEMASPKSTNYKDLSPMSPGRFAPTFLSARASHPNIFQAMSPDQSQRTMEGLIRNPDDSLTVVCGRSRLRNILNNFDKPNHLGERLMSPKIKMNSSSLSPTKVNPKVAPKLKQMKKITGGGSIGGVGENFKSPRPTKEIDASHSQMLKALKITKAKI